MCNYVSQGLFLVPGIAAEITQVIGRGLGEWFLYGGLKMALDDSELGKLKSLFRRKGDSRRWKVFVSPKLKGGLQKLSGLVIFFVCLFFVFCSFFFFLRTEA